MSVLVDANTRLLVQGITGKAGSFHARACREYGTRVVGGVTPARGGESSALEPILRAARDGVAERYRIDPDRIRILPAGGAETRVRGRRADLEIVFRNLVDNAVKYSLPEPEVEIEADGRRGREVVVRVTDNGPGIPAPDRKQVFGRFVRLGSELERSTPGTGLGLHLVRSIVRQLRGRVTILARGGRRGTVMEVRLPAA